MQKNIIVAISDNNAIGRDNKLLWHLSEDLQYFKKTTLGCPVIMGRKTFESIGRPLPKRANIIVSRGNEAPEGTFLVHSIEEAFERAEEILKNAGQIGENGGDRCFVIGGGEIYRQSLPVADKLYITEVHTTIEEADTFFPEIDKDLWREVSRSDVHEDSNSGLTYTFVVYERI